MLVALTMLDGTTAGVNPDAVVRVLAIPARQLALQGPGIAAGCYVDQQDSQGQNETRIAVQGTVAAVMATLNGAGSAVRVVACGLVSGAGVLQPGSTGIASAARTGVGDYTITFDVNPTSPSAVAITPASGAACAARNGPLGLTLQVLMFDVAGAAADESFDLVVFGS